MSREVWRLDKTQACSEPRVLTFNTVPVLQNTKPELDSAH